MTIPEISPLFIISMCGLSTVCVGALLVVGFIVLRFVGGGLFGSVSDLMGGDDKQQQPATSTFSAQSAGGRASTLRQRAQQSGSFEQALNTQAPSAPPPPTTMPGGLQRPNFSERANQWNPSQASGGTFGAQSASTPAQWNPAPPSGNTPAQWNPAPPSGNTPAQWNPAPPSGNTPAQWNPAPPSGNTPAQWNPAPPSGNTPTSFGGQTFEDAPPPNLRRNSQHFGDRHYGDDRRNARNDEFFGGMLDFDGDGDPDI